MEEGREGGREGGREEEREGEGGKEGGRERKGVLTEISLGSLSAVFSCFPHKLTDQTSAVDHLHMHTK